MKEAGDGRPFGQIWGGVTTATCIQGDLSQRSTFIRFYKAKWHRLPDCLSSLIDWRSGLRSRPHDPHSGLGHPWSPKGRTTELGNSAFKYQAPNALEFKTGLCYEWTPFSGHFIRGLRAVIASLVVLNALYSCMFNCYFMKNVDILFNLFVPCTLPRSPPGLSINKILKILQPSCAYVWLYLVASSFERTSFPGGPHFTSQTFSKVSQTGTAYWLWQCTLGCPGMHNGNEFSLCQGLQGKVTMASESDHILMLNRSRNKKIFE